MKIRLLMIALAMLCADAYASDSRNSECVIILHGMGRTSFSMNKMENVLNENGYVTWNESYPSTKLSIEVLANTHIQSGLDFCEEIKPQKIHFVTHSLGGILTRVFLQNKSIDNIGYIVMLSPPNKGSEVVDTLKNFKLYQWATGPAGQDLGTEKSSTPNSLRPVDVKIGVITGESSSDPWFSPIIPGKDDGKVSVESAKLKEMSDFLVIDAGHTFIMRNHEAIEQTIAFLQDGEFNIASPKKVIKH